MTKPIPASIGMGFLTADEIQFRRVGLQESSHLGERAGMVSLAA